MPIAPLVGAGIIAAAGGITAAEINAHSASNAGQTAAQGTSDALNYTEQKDAQDRADALTAQSANYAQTQARDARLQPYLQAGAGASQRLQGGLGLPRVAIQPLPPAPTFTSTFTPTPTTQMPAQTGQMVTMRAPNGSTKQVPSNQVAHYQTLGAQVVN